ncbi:universal stress protein [Candidatus Berkiella aquae]|uniref:Universal stress protein n=1 Tax=Candidatus Berkiella aquae TaxID=295108 RepID=A0A0Q9YFW6_9GAMM|nr:universal stress protein [Candidatus Berkiella aquae]MCS5709849.1 universal stress protein [Candidatus Berkiella aquae]
MQQFQHILFVSHGIEHDLNAMKQALSLAHNNQAQLNILIVTPPFPRALDAYKTAYQQALVEKLQKSAISLQAELGIHISQAIDIAFETTKPQEIHIIQRVIREGYDLLIKAVESNDENEGFKALDMELVRKCPCPVWLFRARNPLLETARVAVAIDPEIEEKREEELSIKLLQVADSLSATLKSELSIITCWDYPLENTLRNSPFIGIEPEHIETIVHEQDINHRKSLDFLINQANLVGPMQIYHKRGLPDMVIPQLITELNIDVLIMGTIGRTGIPGFIIGNTAENVLQKISCSLLALKPNGFISPVKSS